MAYNIWEINQRFGGTCWVILLKTLVNISNITCRGNPDQHLYPVTSLHGVTTQQTANESIHILCLVSLWFGSDRNKR